MMSMILDATAFQLEN